MNHELLNAVKSLVIKFANESGIALASEFKSVAEFQQFIIGLTVKFMVQAGFEIDAALDVVLGSGTFKQIADDVWATLNA